MPEITSQNEQRNGNPGEWDAIWQESDHFESPICQLFTRGRVHSILQFWQRCYFRDLVQTIKPSNDWKVLEMASGRGTTSMYLSDYGLNDITLLDLSPNALEHAKRNFACEGLTEPRLLLADAERTALPSETFDCIYNIGVLEHFEDPSVLLAEAFRLLRPGGSIFMVVVPKMPFRNSIVCRLMFNPLSFAKYFAIVLCRVGAADRTTMTRTKYGPDFYTKTCESIGFRDISCVPYNPYWKVFREDACWGKYIGFPTYRMHHRIKSWLEITPTLRTWNHTSLCLLLTGRRPLTLCD